MQVAVNDGGFAPVALPTATATSVQLRAAITGNYRLRARATDNRGNTSDWATGQAFTVIGDQETAAAQQGRWNGLTAAGSWGGASLATNQAQATLTFTATGAQVSIVGAVGPNRGSFQVYVDGRPRQTVSTAAPAQNRRRILATDGRVEIDGLVSLR